LEIPALQVVRTDYRADTSGFFQPLLQPLDRVKRGTVLGSLIDLTTLQSSPIKSRGAGQLFLISRPGIVRTGDKLYSLAEPA
jgi:predicted deacylase